MSRNVLSKKDLKRLGKMKKVKILTSIITISVYLIFGFFIWLILNGFGVWNIMTIPDRVFLVVAAVMIAVLFGIRREEVIKIKN